MTAGLALVLAALAAPHPDSLSRSLVVVDGAAARLELRVQTLTLIEELRWHFDANDNLYLDDDELAAGRAEIAAYLLAHYRLRVGGAEGPLLQGRLVTAETMFAASDPWATRQWLVATATFEHDAPIEDLVLEMDLFGVSNPQHRDLALVEWNHEEPMSFVLVPSSASFE